MIRRSASLVCKIIVPALALGVLALSVGSCARSQAYKSEGRDVPVADTQWQREDKLQKIKKFAAPRKRTLVLPFWNDTPVRGKFSRVGQRALKDMLKDLGTLNLVDESHVALKSKDFYLDKEKVNVEELAKLGRKWPYL